MHALRPHLSFVIFVQHMLGLISGLLLFGAVRRAGFPRGLGLVPAAVVILGGSELFVEHAPLTEALFIFLVDLSLYSIVRMWRGGWGWALLAGLALGAATDIRSVGLLLLPALTLVALLTAPGAWRRRLTHGVVDPPRGSPADRPVSERTRTIPGLRRLHRSRVLRPLRPRRAVRELLEVPSTGRDGETLHPHSPLAAARPRRLGVHRDLAGRPSVWRARCHRAEAGGEREAAPFAEAAILGQPLEYLEYVGRDLVRIVDPSFPSSPYGNTGPAAVGYGNTPQSLTAYYFNTSHNYSLDPLLAAYYPGDGEVHKSLTFLLDYERDTRVEGPFMALFFCWRSSPRFSPRPSSAAQRRSSYRRASCCS